MQVYVIKVQFLIFDLFFFSIFYGKQGFWLPLTILRNQKKLN